MRTNFSQGFIYRTYNWKIKKKKNTWPILDPNGLWYDLPSHFFRCLIFFIIHLCVNISSKFWLLSESMQTHCQCEYSHFHVHESVSKQWQYHYILAKSFLKLLLPLPTQVWYLYHCTSLEWIKHFICSVL